MGPRVPGSMSSSQRFLSELPWGGHVCHFYGTKEDLIEVVVPFLASGIASDERCFWAVADPLSVEDALRALREAVPDWDRHVERGTVRVRRYDEWYLRDGSFDASEVRRGWKQLLSESLAAGYRGVRAAGSTSWLPKSEWSRFAEYERELNGSLPGQAMKVLCNYTVSDCGTLGVLEVARNHAFAIARRDGAYEVLPAAPERRSAVPETGAGAGAGEEVIPEGEWRRRERANIVTAMRRSKGRIYGREGAAELLALKPSTLQSRIRAFGIRPDEVEPTTDL